LGMETDAVLTQLDTLLDDDQLVQAVTADLARRFPRTASFGRPSTPVEVILRLLIVKHLYHWSYHQTEQWVSDSLVLRQFCRVYTARVPDDTTLLRWANLIGPATLAALNERVVVLARSLRVTRGRKLRVDSTVVETNIHHPTDSGLLGDGVRVLSRLLRRAKAVVGQPASLGPQALRSRMRSVRRQIRQLHRLARHKGEGATAELQQAYRRLIAVAQKSAAQAGRVCAMLQAAATPRAQQLVRQFEQFLPRVARVLAQTVRRIVRGEVVPVTCSPKAEPGGILV
jgi:transposase, IS5 family